MGHVRRSESDTGVMSWTIGTIDYLVWEVCHQVLAVRSCTGALGVRSWKSGVAELGVGGAEFAEFRSYECGGSDFRT